MPFDRLPPRGRGYTWPVVEEGGIRDPSAESDVGRGGQYAILAAGYDDLLADDLRRAFSNMKGFSARNLRYMRSFANAYPDDAILQQAVAKSPWGHHIETLPDQLLAALPTAEALTAELGMEEP